MTELSPMEVLRATQQIERELGRRKKSQSPNAHYPSPDTQSPLPVYHDRPIDIDILLYDDWIVDEPELRIPHPLMYKRDFVMIPLREILD
jgi:2-amino-4-hydroxy-6-hydroxymethyldihydropteridine diphosphokinase